MEFILRIFITGLVALVPGDDGKSLTAILQVTPAVESMRHVPVVLYECKNRYPCSPCGPKISQPLGCALQFKSSCRPSFDGVLLAGDEISVAGAKAGSLTFVQGLRSKHWYHDWIGSRPENRLEAKDISWVPSMSHISQVAGTMAPRHLHAPDPAKIAGVLRLDGIEGAVRAFSFTQLDKQVPSLTFKKPGGLRLKGCKQASADTLLVEVAVSGPDITLAIRPFDQADPRSTVKLKPSPGETTVDVLVGNLFLPCNRKPEDLAMHFGMYYELASRPANEVLIPSLGMRSVASSEVESGEVPAILTDWDQCPHSNYMAHLSFFSSYFFAGFQKPICTLVSFDAP